MKKCYKVILCIALICIVLGFGMLTVGAAQGGIQLFLKMCTNNEFAFSTENLDYWNEKDYKKNEYTFSSDEIKKLDLDIGASIMEIKCEDVEDYQVEIQNNVKYGSTKCYVEDSALCIDSDFNYWGVNFGKQKANKITLVIPKKAKLEEIEFSLGAGSCTGDLLQADAVDIEIGAGNLQMRQLKANENMKLSVGAGNAEFDKLETESLNVVCETGRCYAKKAVTTSDTDLQCDVGYIYMKLQGAQDSYNYDLECSVGSIKIAEQTHSGLDYSKETDYGADKQLAVECNVGSVEIEFDEEI